MAKRTVGKRVTKTLKITYDSGYGVNSKKTIKSDGRSTDSTSNLMDFYDKGSAVFSVDFRRIISIEVIG